MQRYNSKIISIMKSKEIKINELAQKTFDKMILDGYSKALALATTKGVTAKNLLDVNRKVEEHLRKWRGEL